MVNYISIIEMLIIIFFLTNTETEDKNARVSFGRVWSGMSNTKQNVRNKSNIFYIVPTASLVNLDCIFKWMLCVHHNYIGLSTYKNNISSTDIFTYGTSGFISQYLCTFRRYIHSSLNNKYSSTFPGLTCSIKKCFKMFTIVKC